MEQGCCELRLGRVAHTSRVLASASRDRELSFWLHFFRQTRRRQIHLNAILRLDQDMNLPVAIFKVSEVPPRKDHRDVDLISDALRSAVVVLARTYRGSFPITALHNLTVRRA
jgi:hypothetical protein